MLVPPPPPPVELVALPPRGRRSTHFLIEAHAGVAVPAYAHLDLGYGYGATLGLGGKLRGFPPRFYLLFSISGDSFGASRINAATGAPYSTERDELTLLAGLRVAFPLFSPLRLVFDVLGGGMHTSAQLQAATSMRETRWDAVWQLAVALQYRVSEVFSIGLRLSETLGAEDLDIVAFAAGEARPGPARTDVSLTIGYHF